MTKFLPLIAIFSSIASAVAAPKIANVDFVKVIEVYHVAESDRIALTKMRDALTKNKRNVILQERKAKLEEFSKKISGLRRGTLKLNDTERKELMLEAEAARSAYAEIKAEWDSWSGNETKKIQKEFVARSRTTLNKIAAISQEVGESLGYDWVVDLKGYTSSQMPVIVYVRDSTDITDEVIKVINKDAPPKKEGEEKEGDDKNPE